MKPLVTCVDNYEHLQSDINIVYINVFRKILLTLNPEKCKYLLCSRKPHPILPPSGLHLNHQDIERVHQYRYLGVILSEKTIMV